MAITADEIRQMYELFKNEGKSDEEIIAAIFLIFKDGEITIEEFKNTLNVLGYDLSEEYLNLPEEQQKDEDVFFKLDSEE